MLDQPKGVVNSRGLANMALKGRFCDWLGSAEVIVDVIYMECGGQ